MLKMSEWAPQSLGGTMAASGLESKGEEGNFSHIIVYGKLKRPSCGSVSRERSHLAHTDAIAEFFHVILLMVSVGRGESGCYEC